MAESPIVDDDTSAALGGDIVGKQTGTSSTLSPYVGPYVTEDVLAAGELAHDTLPSFGAGDGVADDADDTSGEASAWRGK